MNSTLEYIVDPNAVLLSSLTVWLIGIGIGAAIKLFKMALESSNSNEY